MKRWMMSTMVAGSAVLLVACSNAPAVTGSVSGSQDGAATAAQDGIEVAEEAPFFIATMTHMEGNWADDEIEATFLRHVENLRYGMDLFDEYGAKMTVESEKPFAIANTVWDLNILQEVLDAGHGVGTHCDVGFTTPLMPVEDFAALLAENKALVDDLVGAENNRGCSGGGGSNDWAQAMALAGFDYVDGIVGMHYLAMPLEARPEGWTDQYIRAGAYHENAPVDLANRIHPFMLANTLDFEEDEDGIILVSSGELGALNSQAERAAGVTSTPNAELTNEDIDVLMVEILKAYEVRDPSEVAKVTVYIPANLFEPEHEKALRYFLEEVDKLVQDGTLTWATQGQVYDAWVTWNEA